MSVNYKPMKLIPDRTYEGIVHYLFPDKPKPIKPVSGKPQYYQHKFILLVEARFFRLPGNQAPIQVHCEYLNLNPYPQEDFRLGERVIFYLKSYYRDVANVYLGSRENLLDTEAELIKEERYMDTQNKTVTAPAASSNETLNIIRCLHHIIELYKRKGSFSIDRVWNDILRTYEIFNGRPYEPQPGVEAITLDDCMAYAIPYCKVMGITKVEEVCKIARHIYRKVNGLSDIE